MHIRNILSYSCLSVLLLLSCNKDPLSKWKKLHGAQWNGSYAAPLVNADLTLKDAVDLVSSDLLSNMPDQSPVIVYEARHFSKRGDELFALNDQSFNGLLALTTAEANTLNTSGTVNAVRDFVFNFNPGTGVSLDSILLKAGGFLLSAEINTSHQGKLVIEYPDLKVDGIPITLETTWSTGGVITRSLNHQVGSLENLSLSEGNLGFNQLRMKASLQLTKSGAVSGGDQVQLNANTQGLKFRKIYGLLGSFNLLAVKDSLDLSLFTNNILNGNIQFEDARVKLLFQNSAGFSYQYSISQLALSYNAAAPANISAYPATGSFSGAVSGPVVSTAKDSVYITQASGSNVAILMKQEPNSLLYTVSANAGLGKSYLWDESTLGLTVSVELPLFVSTKNLVLEDTTDVNLGLGKEAEYVEMIKLKMQAENGIPLGAAIQLYFMDASFQTLDSLIQPFRYVLKQADVDAGGNVIASSKDQWELVLEKPRIKNILNAKKVRIKAWIPTSNFGGNAIPVKITASQKIKIKLGAEIKLSADATF